ncbi:diaminopimelate epimerase [Candidatus Woesearchaeota archaeon]|nr:diaminopimelate epimerase [Candidatus Woesearchaeota archaeon]
MNFSKMHGLENDFVIITDLEGKIGRYNNIARQMCNRNLGIGADGLLVVRNGERTPYKMVIYNPDGSQAETCGNGIRCFAKYLHDHGLISGREIRIEDVVKSVDVEINEGDGKKRQVRVDMMEPKFYEPEKVTMNPKEYLSPRGLIRGIVDFPIEQDGIIYLITYISMGNPHVVIFNRDYESLDLAVEGPAIGKATQYFPKKTNVEFVDVINPNKINVKVWERGAGITLACGTGACASTVASILKGKTAEEVLVHLPGGDLTISWDSKNDHVYMEGPAETVCEGIFLMNSTE